MRRGVGFLDPVSAAAGVTQLVNLFDGGAKTDQERQARVNYVLSAALGGNVAAAQLILGAPSNVSGNERDMWTKAWSLLVAQAPAVATAAQTAGAHWLVGSGDTATNYPATRAYINSWALANQPVQALTQGIFGTTGAAALAGGSSAMPLLLLGGVAMAAFLFMKKR